MDKRAINPDLKIHNPPPGIVIYRPTESFTYPNASTQLDVVVDEIKRITKRGKANAFPTLGDRPWNDPGPRKGFSAQEIDADTRPVLQAVVFDFSAVATIDTTGIQCLVDTRRQINKYADRDVEFHFANIISPWVRRALIAGGFGGGTPAKETLEIAAIVPPNEAMSINNSREGFGTDAPLKKRVTRWITNKDHKDGRFNQLEEYDLNQIERGDSDDVRYGPVLPNEYDPQIRALHLLYTN